MSNPVARPTRAQLDETVAILREVYARHDRERTPLPEAFVATAAWLAAGAPPHADATERLHEGMWTSKGATCPTCGRHAQVRRREIYGTQAVALIRVARYFARPDADEWLHMQRFLGRWKDITAQGGDPARLFWWGLLERKPGLRDDGSHRRGLVKITELGRDWANGLARVPAYKYFFDNAPIDPPRGEEIPMVTIQDVLGTKFDYRALTTEQWLGVPLKSETRDEEAAETADASVDG